MYGERERERERGGREERERARERARERDLYAIRSNGDDSALHPIQMSSILQALGGIHQ